MTLQGKGLQSSTPESWHGQRHNWNVRVGQMAAEVLEWLQGDELFDPTSDVFKAVSPDFHASRPNAKSEEGMKFIYSGYIGTGCSSGACCTLSLADPIPFSRFQMWFLAFRRLNKDRAGGGWQRRAHQLSTRGPVWGLCRSGRGGGESPIHSCAG